MGRWRRHGRKAMVLEQVSGAEQELYDGRPNKNLKRHAVSFTKGLPGASSMRVELHSEHDQIKLGDRVAKYLQELAHEGSIATP